MPRRKPKLEGVDVRKDERYRSYLRHLKLKGLSLATQQSYQRAFRLALQYFGAPIDTATREDLSRYFDYRLKEKSMSTVAIDAAALKFYFVHVIEQPWHGEKLVKTPRVQRLPDIVSIEEVQRLINGTTCVSYRVFYFTLYSLGLRLTEGLSLQVKDIDAQRGRVHVRNSKGRKDRLVPLPPTTLSVLRRFWTLHRNKQLLFPNRAGGIACSAITRKPLDSSGVQKALHRVCEDIGIKKTLPRTAFGIATPHTWSKRALSCNRFSVFWDTPISTRPFVTLISPKPVLITVMPVSRI